MRIYAKRLFEDGVVEYDDICKAVQNEQLQNIRIEDIEIQGRIYKSVAIDTKQGIYEAGVYCENCGRDYSVVYKEAGCRYKDEILYYFTFIDENGEEVE